MSSTVKMYNENGGEVAVPAGKVGVFRSKGFTDEKPGKKAKAEAPKVEEVAKDSEPEVKKKKSSKSYKSYSSKEE